jgi:hypothetical protein
MKNGIIPENLAKTEENGNNSDLFTFQFGLPKRGKIRPLYPPSPEFRTFLNKMRI